MESSIRSKLLDGLYSGQHDVNSDNTLNIADVLVAKLRFPLYPFVETSKLVYFGENAETLDEFDLIHWTGEDLGSPLLKFRTNGEYIQGTYFSELDFVYLSTKPHRTFRYHVDIMTMPGDVTTQDGSNSGIYIDAMIADLGGIEIQLLNHVTPNLDNTFGALYSFSALPNVGYDMVKKSQVDGNIVTHEEWNSVDIYVESAKVGENKPMMVFINGRLVYKVEEVLQETPMIVKDADGFVKTRIRLQHKGLSNAPRFKNIYTADITAESFDANWNYFTAPEVISVDKKLVLV